MRLSLTTREKVGMGVGYCLGSFTGAVCDPHSPPQLFAWAVVV